jgi:Protein of unknown function (DUF2384)
VAPDPTTTKSATQAAPARRAQVAKPLVKTPPRRRVAKATVRDEAAPSSLIGDLSGPAWQPSRRADFLVDILGNKLVADLLNVAQSQPSRWRRAQEVPGPQVAPVLVDLDHVVGRLLLLWDRGVVGDWLTGPNAFLDGARPIDVLATRGSSEVIDAIEAETAGAYA